MPGHSTMDPAVGLAGSSVVFEDPLGQRRPSADPNGADTLELLCLRSELTAVSSFEFALRERVARLANFRHAYYARVRGVERLKGGSTLALVSERTPGFGCPRCSRTSNTKTSGSTSTAPSV